MSEVVHFYPPNHYRPAVLAAYTKHQVWLSQLLPDADIQHVGSSAIEGAWSKGDLDIAVRVKHTDFSACDRRLANVLERNTGNPYNDCFASFKNDAIEPPLGVHLVVVNSPYDDFVQFRDQVTSNPVTLTDYNALKRHHDGGCVNTYREAKASFIETVLARRPRPHDHLTE